MNDFISDTETLYEWRRRTCPRRRTRWERFMRWMNRRPK